MLNIECFPQIDMQNAYTYKYEYIQCSIVIGNVFQKKLHIQCTHSSSTHVAICISKQNTPTNKQLQKSKTNSLGVSAVLYVFTPPENKHGHPKNHHSCKTIFFQAIREGKPIKHMLLVSHMLHVRYNHEFKSFMQVFKLSCQKAESCGQMRSNLTSTAQQWHPLTGVDPYQKPWPTCASKALVVQEICLKVDGG